ncbi:MAG: anaerobic ribonucleoside-triphosphate reductase, partial [Coriobacteriales bacterium]
RSMCCRLRLDLRELRKKSGGYFGSGESTGSIGVVTINMPRIAYQSTDEADFYRRLDHLMDLSARSLKTKRTVITKLLDAGLYPYTKRYLGSFENHFSTIGLVGMNEACLNARWLRADLTDRRSLEFTKNVLNHMRERLSDYQEQYGDLYNLEATPAESTTYRFAKHDKEQFPDIITANEHGTPYYTNSSHLPVGYTDDIFSALDIQDELQTLYTSGTVFHAFLGEKLPSWQASANLVRKIAENYKLPYYTLSPTYSICKNHGYLSGEVWECPECHEETEVYSRITGYYRPVKNWNDGKAQEFKDRRLYDLSLSHAGHHHGTAHVSFDETHAAAAGEQATEDGLGLEPGLYLVATRSCPNCKYAVQLLQKNGVSYHGIFADEHPEIVERFAIKQAPTLLEVAQDGSVTAIHGAADVLKAIPAMAGVTA